MTLSYLIDRSLVAWGRVSMGSSISQIWVSLSDESPTYNGDIQET